MIAEAMIKIIVMVTIPAFFLLVYLKTRKKSRKEQKVVMVVMTGVVILCFAFSFPIIKHGYVVQTISEALNEGDYVLAKEISKKHLMTQYSPVEQVILGNIIGGSPRAYFLSIVAVCEYKQKNYKTALIEINKLISYAERSSYPDDKEYIIKGKKLLKIIAKRVTGS